jgi:dihydroorotate dehydrogenase (fumarate)
MPTDPEMTSQEIEASYVELVSEVRAAVDIPISLKLTPFFTALPNVAKRCVQAGADGLVFFNRVYQPDFDLEELEVIAHLELSTARELYLPLRWIALLYGRIDADFALTSGVHSAPDVLKAMMAGASVVMLASSLLTNGIKRLTTLRDELYQWMEEHEYESITQMKGSMSYLSVADPVAFERANYMKALNSFDRVLP